jgi:hypothetical protein
MHIDIYYTEATEISSADDVHDGAAGFYISVCCPH